VLETHPGYDENEIFLAATPLSGKSYTFQIRVISEYASQVVWPRYSSCLSSVRRAKAVQCPTARGGW